MRMKIRKIGFFLWGMIFLLTGCNQTPTQESTETGSEYVIDNR